jgi:AraC-like DNA-binding protein
MYNPLAYFDTSHWLNRISPCLWAVNSERNEPGWHESRPRPRFNRLIVLRSGSIRLTAEDRAFQCNANEFILVPAVLANDVKVVGRQTAWRYWIDFDWNFVGPYDSGSIEKASIEGSRYVDRIQELIPPYAPADVVRDAIADPSYIFDQLDRICFRWCSEQSLQQMSCRGIFLEILIYLMAQQSPIGSSAVNLAEVMSEGHLAGKIRYLLSNFARHPIDSRPSVEKALAELGHSYGYLSRIFKEDTGTTPLHYVNKLRMEHAADMLRDTELTFAEIGYRVGINNPSYFSRMFKKHTGKSPSEFRALGRGNRREPADA